MGDMSSNDKEIKLQHSEQDNSSWNWYRCIFFHNYLFFCSFSIFSHFINGIIWPWKHLSSESSTCRRLLSFGVMWELWVVLNKNEWDASQALTMMHDDISPMRISIEYLCNKKALFDHESQGISLFNADTSHILLYLTVSFCRLGAQ